MPRSLTTLFLALLALLLAAPAADAAGGRQRAKLDETQAAFAGALRWSDYGGAWQLVDPEYRSAHPLSDLEFERYRQLQVSSYREGLNSELPDGSVVREVEIGVINRHTQAERVVRWRERWRWDAEAKRWWQVGGLPDFWDGR
ncbi:MAG TPA: hypothetical protein VFF91_00825 [Pseudoxanthomonas sp.]|nr:hypothetical protein [Pseudoxanthomonas sp.]